MYNCYSWGFNDDGQRGHFNEEPSQIKQFMDVEIENVYCGLWHTMILTKSNELYGFGYNGNGEVSVNSNQSKHPLPYHLTREEIGIHKECKIEGVITGYRSTLILVAKIYINETNLCKPIYYIYILVYCYILVWEMMCSVIYKQYYSCFKHNPSVTAIVNPLFPYQTPLFS